MAGTTDKMVAFQCTREGGYKCETVLQPLDIVANFEKKVPREWINEAGNGVTQEFIDYVPVSYTHLSGSSRLCWR